MRNPTFNPAQSLGGGLRPRPSGGPAPVQPSLPPAGRQPRRLPAQPLGVPASPQMSPPPPPPPQSVAFGPPGAGVPPNQPSGIPSGIPGGMRGFFSMPGAEGLDPQFIEMLKRRFGGAVPGGVPQPPVSGMMQSGGTPSVGFRPQGGLGAFPRRPWTGADLEGGGGYVGMPGGYNGPSTLPPRRY